MAKRVYFVTDNDETHRFIRANNGAQALRHVAEDVFDVEVATQQDMIDHWDPATCKIEEVGKPTDQPELPLEGGQA